MDYQVRLEQIRADSRREVAAVSGVFQSLIAVGAGAVLILWIASQTHLFPGWIALAALVPARLVWSRMGKIQRRSN
ncbi:MAG: hypothetical protein ACRD5L_17270, partial [Bryobacteraceae bacterium]